MKLSENTRNKSGKFSPFKANVILYFNDWHFKNKSVCFAITVIVILLGYILDSHSLFSSWYFNASKYPVLNNLLRYKNHSIIKNLLFTESIFLFHRRLCCKRYLRIHRENDINSNRDKKFHCRIDVSKLCEFDDYKHILYYKFRCWQKYKTGINI